MQNDSILLVFITFKQSISVPLFNEKSVSNILQIFSVLFQPNTNVMLFIITHLINAITLSKDERANFFRHK
jgi:hypothetical protein